MTAAAQRGTTIVSERAVRRIAERAAGERLPGPGARASASVRGGRAELSLGVELPYPVPLGETVGTVRQHVVERTRRLTGLDVTATRVTVTTLAPSAPPRPAVPPSPDAGPDARTPRRRWSRRRVPVALLTVAAAVGCGALALDLVRVHTAHLAPAGWRTSAVHWLSGHGPGDAGVAVGGVLMALAGLWAVLLALTPGRRRWSTVLAVAPRVDTEVDRSAVGALLREAVGDVDGVGAVRVKVRRRRVAVRAGLAFGDGDRARTAVTAAARDALAACRLRRAPRLRVRVVPEPVWRPPAVPAAGGER